MRKALFVAFAALRACVVLLSVEVSGLAHTGLDLFDALRGISSELAEDCDDGCGDECPPGCPSCHCAHGSSAPREVLTWVERDSAPPASVLAPEVSAAPPADQAPAGADPASIYRPPRRGLYS